MIYNNSAITLPMRSHTFHMIIVVERTTRRMSNAILGYLVLRYSLNQFYLYACIYVCICIIFYAFNDKHLIFAYNFDYELLIILIFNEIVCVYFSLYITTI